MVVSAAVRNAQAFLILAGALNDAGHFSNGMNLYAYLGANAVNSTDPSGLKEHHIWPLHLGGPSDGPGIDLDDASHQAFHDYLSKKGFPFGDKGRAKWAALSDAERRGYICDAARAAGVDVTDKGFQKALKEAAKEANAIIRKAKGADFLQPRAACRYVLRLEKAENGVADKLVRRVSGGRLDKLGAIGKGMAVVGGVMYGMQMMDSLRIDNPYVWELAVISRRIQNTGQMTIMDEAAAADDLYHLTGDCFSGAYAWNYWRDTVW